MNEDMLLADAKLLFDLHQGMNGAEAVGAGVLGKGKSGLYL